MAKAAPIKSDRTTAHVREAERCLERGNLAGAETAAILALALAADDPRALRVLARVHRGRNQLESAEQCLRDAIAASPGDPALKRELAGVLAARGRRDDAIALLGDPPPASALDWFTLGCLQDEGGDASAAMQSAQSALALDPAHAGAKLLLARTLVARGDIDAAAAIYREMTRRPESAARAWFALADLKTVPLADDELQRLQRLQASPNLPSSEQTLVAFACGLALEQAQRLPEAYRAFAAGNRRQHRLAPWQAKPFESLVEDLLQAFDAPAAAAGGQGSEVVFLPGMPRSGSTLAEQILAAHPDVVGASELNDLPKVIAAESQRRRQPFPQWVARASEADWLRLGAEYLERTRGFQSRRRFTDKYPENWLYAGAIPRMLPGARIVFCERDMIETLWSCYKQLFAPGFFTWSYDFDSLARYAAACQRLCRQVASREPERCHFLSHEALLADIEGEIRRTLAFIGLDFDPACLEFASQRRETRTASAAQVRQPLRRATSRTAGYGALLDDLREAWSRAQGDG